MKTKILIISLWLFLCMGCSEKTGVKNEVEIELNKVELYLKMPVNADAETPPVIMLDFTIKNLTKEERLFICKAGVGDDVKSRLLLLDTVKNVIIPIYSGDKPIIKSNEKISINGEIAVKDIASYLTVDKQFFKKVDFSEDKEMLERVTNGIIKNSVIVFLPDRRDMDSYTPVGEHYLSFGTMAIKVKKSL